MLDHDNALQPNARSATSPREFPDTSPTVNSNEPTNINVIRSNANIAFIVTFGNNPFYKLDYEINLYANDKKDYVNNVRFFIRYYT